MKSSFHLFFAFILSTFSIFAASCSKPMSPRVETSSVTFENLSDSPLPSTEVNCADQEDGEQGHSPGPGMNHCGPSSESKQKAREMFQMGDR